MVVIVGESASGKSTLQKMLIYDFPGIFKKMVTYTTRPKRNSEVDGIDYHFISIAEFDLMQESGAFIESAEYNGWKYGTPFPDEKDIDKLVTVLTPSGLRALKRAGIDVISVYLFVDRRSRLIKALNRGDDIEEAYRRNLSDVGQFDGIAKEVDIIIENEEYALSCNEIEKTFLREYAELQFFYLQEHIKTPEANGK